MNNLTRISLVQGSAFQNALGCPLASSPKPGDDRAIWPSRRKPVPFPNLPQYLSSASQPKPGAATAIDCWCPPQDRHGPQEDAREHPLAGSALTGLLRLTDCLPLRKGSIHKALSLIHHGAPDRASHRLPLLHARCLWFVGHAGFVQVHLILSRKTADAQSPHCLSNRVFRGAQSTACFIPPLLWGRPDTRAGSSPTEPPAGRALLCEAKLHRAALEAPLR